MKIYPKMDSKNTALLVIDVVNGCCHKKCETPEWKIKFSKIRRMVPKLAKFINDFRNKVGGKVIFFNVSPWTKEYLPRNMQELYDNEPKSYAYSDDGTGFSEEFYLVQPQENDFVFTKNNYDCFVNLDFKKILKENYIRYLVVTGVFTDGCVLATVCGGFQAGFSFVILKDLIETTDVKKRQDLQKLLKEYTFPVMYGKTVNSKEFLGTWLTYVNLK